MTTLSMRRILIVEDNLLVAEHIASVIHEGGFVPIGPLFSVGDAEDMIDDPLCSIDGAILDVHLERTSETLALRLDKRRIPFIFSTGHRTGIPLQFQDRPYCEKPFTPQKLLAALRAVFEPDAIIAERMPPQAVHLATIIPLSPRPSS